jgi:hypothetical protein
MFSPIDDATATRMLAAQRHAAAVFQRMPTGEPVWGWRGRTIGSRADSAEGPAWLRIQSAPAAQASGKIWEGTALADRLMPTLAKPALLGLHDWESGGMAYRAELTEFITDPVCSPDPVLRRELDLPPEWFGELRANLEIIAAVDTDRTVISQDYLDRTMPAFLDVAAGRATRAPAWTTAHGDVHFANLTAPNLRLLDLEGFGAAPAGYDAATLYTYSLLAPRTAAAVYAAFADILDSTAGRFAQLAIATELLQSCTRGDNLELQGALEDRLRTLIGPPLTTR